MNQDSLNQAGTPEEGPRSTGTVHWRHPDDLPALRYVGSTDNARVLSRILTVVFLVAGLALVVTPWQQTVSGTGKVTAFAPIERIQEVQAPVDGRIVRWNVVEGSRVKSGDVLLEMADNDPALVQRILQEKDALLGTLQAEERKVESYREKIRGLEETRRNAVYAAQSRIDVAADKIRAAQQYVAGAEAAYLTARLNQERQQKLAEKGLSSTRNLELAQLQFNKTLADLDQARASLNAERNSRIALESEMRRIDADMAAKIEDARASLQEGLSSVQKARAEITKIDVRLARQSTQRVTAPIGGTILRVVARQWGEQLKTGATLAVLVPESSKDVVELWVDGRDIPLISRGRHVRLQFEGWPALQFSGWPSIAVGTFGGRVMMIDATDNGKGDFRVLIEPDPADESWPAQAYLRQGALANGWILLNQVPLGFELWRQFNGFPPVLAQDEPAVDKKAGL